MSKKTSFSTLDQHVKRFSGLYVLDPGIYLATFGSCFDMAMTMWRVQETFDSPYADECEGNPNMVDFMEWYAKNHGKQSFSYTDDFHGFNINGVALDKAYNRETPFADWTRYDTLLKSLWQTIQANEAGKEFCLIATLEGDVETLKHELAHCYYALDDEYKDRQVEHVKNLQKGAVSMYDVLVGMGYSPQVVIDETQAYMATGLIKKMKKKLGGTHKSLCKPFIDTFEKRLKGTEAAAFVSKWEKAA